MTVGRNVERGGHVVGFIQDVAEASAVSDDAFFTWFNDAQSAADALAKGEADFVAHVLDPLSQHVPRFDPSKLTALEIGFGGGRLVAAAAGRFSRVVGIDIHDQAARVAEMLAGHGVDNVELLRTDGRSIPLPNASVDIAYSFIVLQHVEFITVFRRYFEEIARVLKPDGWAVLYFGRLGRFSYGRRSRWLLWLDRLIEPILLRGGYREVEAQVNCYNLFVSIPYARRLATELGLEVEAELVSYRIDKGGERRYGRQNGLLLRRR